MLPRFPTTTQPPPAPEAPPAPRKLVLVGEANPYGEDPRYALYDEPKKASGYRLRTLVLGLQRRTYFQFERVNLCTGLWTLKKARAKAGDLMLNHPEADFLLLGRKVASAFHLGKMPAFTVVGRSTGGKFILLPHPSGLCREWDREGAFEQARELLRLHRPDVPWGELAEAERNLPDEEP